jgi:hypothetical protein
MEKLTAKQRGDAAEHYVISMLGFNGTPAAKMPDGWPSYDIVAQPPAGVRPVRISVKFRNYHYTGDPTRTYFTYEPNDEFDFIACVLKHQTGFRTWIVPRGVADATTYNLKPRGKQTERWWTLKTLESC